MTIFPQHKKSLGIMGENIKLARLRRKITSEMMCERANITAEMLVEIENGNPEVYLGDYFNVMRVLGLQQDIFNISKDDILGRKLQDIELLSKK
jgi:transcriptional regulator with XRE-family HTH domain